MPGTVHIPDSTFRLFREHGKRIKLQSVSARETCRNPVIEGGVGASAAGIAHSFETGCRPRIVAHWIDVHDPSQRALQALRQQPKTGE